MRHVGVKVISVCAFVLLGFTGSATARRLVLGEGSGLWLEGDSTLHVFHSTATELRASGEADASKPLLEGAMSDFSFTVPVRGLKSGKVGLDQNMRKALKADQFPEIVFRLSRLSREEGSEGGARFEAAGTLTVAGRDKEVLLRPEAREEGGRFMIEGTQDLRMTDFGVKPPVMMLGAVRTRNEVKIRYRIFIEVEEEKQEEKP